MAAPSYAYAAQELLLRSIEQTTRELTANQGPEKREAARVKAAALKDLALAFQAAIADPQQGDPRE